MMTAVFACKVKPLSSKLSTVSSHYEIQNRRWLSSSVVLFSLWGLLLKLPHGIFAAVILIEIIFLIVHLPKCSMKLYRLAINLITV